MFIYDLSIFLTSTAFVDTNAKYGIHILRYTVFFENYPFGYDPNIGAAFVFKAEIIGFLQIKICSFAAFVLLKSLWENIKKAVLLI